MQEKASERQSEIKRERESRLVERLAQAFKYTHADKVHQFKFAPMKMKQESVQFDDTNTLLIP